MRDNNLYKISKNINEINEVYGELVGISKISLGLYKDMIKAYKIFMDNMKYHEESDKKTSNYDYEIAIFDAAKNRKVGYLKIDNLLWGEIDDKYQLDRVKKSVLPRLENTNI